MVKKIGNLFVLILLLTTAFKINAESSLSFSITDFHDKKIGWAGVGVPFLLSVVVTGDQQIADEPEVQGLDDFHVRSAGTFTNFHIVNNVTTVVQHYKYIIRIDKVGNYKIGPATVKTPEGVIRSHARTLTVKDSPEQESQKEVSDAFLRLSIEPQEGYLGQKFILKVRFYATGRATITRLFKPEFTGFWIGQFVESTAGLEEINGLDYRYVEYRAPIIPKETGDLIIQSMEAEYQIPSKRRSGFGFFALFDRDIEFRRTISKPITLPVLPLPKSSIKADGVGPFSQFKASVDHAEGQVGQGIVYTIILEGDADLEHTNLTALSMPDVITYYDSKNSIEVGNVDHGDRKIFEYIIQAQEPGKLIIPSQKFTYFDPAAKEYKTLHTKPIELTITPGESNKTYYEEKSTEAISYTEPTDNIKPLNEHGPWLPVRYREIPFGWFIFLLFFPLLIGLSLWLAGIYRWYYDKNVTYFAYKGAFRKARNALRICTETNGAAGLYDLFIRLFAARSHLVPSSVNNEYVQDYLGSKISQDQLQEWNRFFKTVQEIRFYGKTPGRKICDEAASWLNLFEEVL